MLRKSTQTPRPVAGKPMTKTNAINASTSTDPRIGEIDALAQRLLSGMGQRDEVEQGIKAIRASILSILVEGKYPTVNTQWGQCQPVPKTTKKYRSSAVTAAAKAVREAEKALKGAKARLSAAQDLAEVQGKCKVVEKTYELRFVAPKG